jgi:hypothetical protein
MSSHISRSGSHMLAVGSRSCDNAAASLAAHASDALRCPQNL